MAGWLLSLLASFRDPLAREVEEFGFASGLLLRMFLRSKK
jgi:hypothetical protein